METKFQTAELCELKSESDGWTIAGYAAVFGSTDSDGDTIHPGAFTKSISDRMPLMRFEHLRYLTIGRWSKAEENSKGLYVEGELTKGHSVASDLRASMQHGTISGLSIGFKPEKYKSKSGRGRDYYEVKLVEVSPTATPAEPSAIIESFKSELANISDLSDFENFLRDSGNYSKSMAIALISQFKALTQRESVDDVEYQKCMSDQIAGLIKRAESIQKLVA